MLHHRYFPYDCVLLFNDTATAGINTYCPPPAIHDARPISGRVTGIQLRLYGIQEAVSAAVCQYPTLEAAVNTVILTIQSGIPVARIELLDDEIGRAHV